MNETEYNKLGTFNIIDITKLIIDRSELNELKELVIVSKYFNSIVNEQFPKLRKTFIILDEYCTTMNIISTKDRSCYSYLKIKYLNRKLKEFIFRLLRKNETIIANKIIHHVDKYIILTTFERTLYYRLFERIILRNYSTEQILLRNLIKISPLKVNWSILIDYFTDWFEDLKIEYIIITILDLLKAAIFVDNEDLILTLVKGFYQYDYKDHEENPKDTLLELISLIESLEKSSDIYGDIASRGLY